MASDSETMKSEEIHVLMVAFHAQGHINPMLRLGHHLISKGLHVSLATTEIAKRRMLAAATATTAVAGIEILFFSDGFDLDYDRKTNMDHYMDKLGTYAPVYLSELIQERYLNKNKKLSCIIGNPFIPWVADVAAKYRIPCALLWIQPCALFSIYYHYYNSLSEFPANSNVEIPGLPPLQTGDLPSFVLPSNSSGSVSKTFACLFQNMKKHKWVFANSFLELEKEAIEAMDEIFPVKPVGPLVPPSLLDQESDLDVQIEMWKPDETCIEWLDRQEQSSVLYISFGSIVELSAKQMEEIAIALKNLRTPFIWVVKKPAFPSDDRRGELPFGFSDETKDQGIVVSWSPQTGVLAHPAVGCFITHGGWNSLLETITAGVPVIAFPQWTDQPANAKMIEDVFKMGLRLKLGEDGVAGHVEIERCVRDVMFGLRSEEFKRKCRELKIAARVAVSDAGSSEKNIQMFVDEIIGSD